MLRLPPVDGSQFPANTAASIRRFWLRYWLCFFLLLPWMLLRQLGVSAHHVAAAIATWNRRVELLDGKLTLLFLNGLPALAVTAVFGERFTAIRYGDVLVDPGPVFARRRVRRFLARGREPIAAIVATHGHEEHVGNAAAAQELTGAPIHGSAITLAAIADPPRLSLPRRLFIGQPAAARAGVTEVLGYRLETPHARLRVIESPGHCDGHASLFDPETGVLLAGDSFLHTVFTSPNADVSSAEWIRTLEDYARMEVRTMVGTHGIVFSVDPRIPPRRFLVRRSDPRALIRDKLTFLRWAREVVAEGERRGLPYSVIEACLFPWQRWWSWTTWFGDEGSRLFSAGEFSRTHFVRSLSATPERVPARFPPFARLVAWLQRALRRSETSPAR